ncbi:MAG: hypothetical protein ACRDRV_19815 [Pseudonocardiaceae bacterium]
MSASRSGDLSALQAIARSLRARIDALDPAERAYAQLWQDEQLQPWSAGAEAIWERQQAGTDATRCGEEAVWTVHHLAVLHHARAYDLEHTAGVEVAYPHWEKALGHWAWLYGSDRFWAALAQHVAQATGRELPGELVTDVRERLPAQLLGVHTSLAAEHRLRDPDSARRHMSLVAHSAFPPATIAAARRGLAADLDNRIAQAVQRSKFGAVFDDVVAWLRIDPTNQKFLRNLLYVSNNWAEFLNKQERWRAAMGELIAKVDELLYPALPQQGDEWAALATEVARHEFWRGFSRADSVRELEHSTSAPPQSLRADLQALNVAIEHFRRALELDPSLALSGYYNANRELAKVLTRTAELAVRLGQDPQRIEESVRAALELKPDHQPATDLLARLSLSSGNTDSADAIVVESVHDEVRRGEFAAAVTYFEILVRKVRNLRECADVEPLSGVIRPHVLDSVRLSRRLEDAMNELRRKKARFQVSPWAEGQ